MNTEILEQYGIQFFKKSDGRFDVEATNKELEIYVYIYRYAEDVELLLNDINLALNGNYNQIEDSDWGGELGTITYFGIINDDMSFSIFHGDFPHSVIDYPLEDIKEIFQSWLEFLEN